MDHARIREVRPHTLKPAQVACCMAETKLKDALEFRGEHAYGDTLRILQETRLMFPVDFVFASVVGINPISPEGCEPCLETGLEPSTAISRCTATHSQQACAKDH